MVSQGGIDCEVGKVLSDRLRHITDHLDHGVRGELVHRDVRWTVPARNGTEEPVLFTEVR